MFDVLRSDGRIAEEQYDNVAKLKGYRRFLKESEPDVKTISTSGDFSETSLETLRKKIEFLDWMSGLSFAQVLSIEQ